MGRLVTPKVYLVGYTAIDLAGLTEYLKNTGNEAFLDDVAEARRLGLSDGEILCSFYAKLCYASLTVGHNKNITQVRDIAGNVRGCFDMGHGSVFEHASINFVVHNCSRVFTHELVRHRAGTAFSQTSGRYVRGDEVDIVFDPVLEPVRGQVERLQGEIESAYRWMVERMGLDNMTDRDKKKQITSALRRILPNGQSNEIGFSVNLRALRHTVMMRTAAGAEWEIREVFGQIYHLTKKRFPLLYHGAREEIVGGQLQVSGMKMQPYEEKDRL